MAENRKSYPKSGAWLIKRREGFSGLSPSAWAETHGFTQTHYNHLQTGARRIRIECGVRLCDRYGLTLDAIYRGGLDGLLDQAWAVF